jgi:hypothetical protein
MVPGEDGQCGSMSMCSACLEVFKKQVGLDGYRVEPAVKPMTVAELLERMEETASDLFVANQVNSTAALLRDARALLDLHVKSHWTLEAAVKAAKKEAGPDQEHLAGLLLDVIDKHLEVTKP